MLEVLREQTKLIVGRGQYRATVGVVLALLLFLALASVANAQLLSCTDCHGTSPHAAVSGGDCTSCHPRSINHPTGSGTPGIGADACKTCHATSVPAPAHHDAAIDVQIICGQCHGGSAGTSAIKNGAPYATESDLARAASIMHTGGIYTPPMSAITPSASYNTLTQTGYTVSFTDTSSDSDDTSNLDVVTVNWGDGAISTGIRGDLFTHIYDGTRVRSVSIVHMVRDSVDSKLFSTETIKVVVPVRYNVTGTVLQSDGTTAITNVYVYLKQSNHTRQIKKATSGTFTFSNVLPGAYTVHVYKSGVTFHPDASANVTIGDLVSNITASTP